MQAVYNVCTFNESLVSCYLAFCYAVLLEKRAYILININANINIHLLFTLCRRPMILIIRMLILRKADSNSIRFCLMLFWSLNL